MSADARLMAKGLLWVAAAAVVFVIELLVIP